MKTKIYEVDSVQVTVTSVNGHIRVDSNGKVNTSGWSDSALVDTPRPPSDGRHHLDFVAEPPTGIVLQVITPIAAGPRSLQAGAGRFCVVVHSATNEIEQCVDVQIGDPK